MNETTNLPERLRTFAAVTALLVYTFLKYTAGQQPFSVAYALQVLILVALTAVLPWGLVRGAERLLPRLRWPLRCVLPAVLACAGYAVFFWVFIAPAAPDVPAAAVVPRGVLPGIVMTALLAVPDAVRAVPRRSAPTGVSA
jgi:hypothetical protein